MKWTVLLLALLGLWNANARDKSPEFDAGRAYYADGEFRKAANHFELAVKDDPEDADANYWTGMAYQRLADISTPFGGRYSTKARRYLLRAAELSPNRADYRLEAFNHLLDSADAAHTRPRREAAALLRISESDPEHAEMSRRYEASTKIGLSADAILTRLFLTGPKAAYDMSSIPASALLRFITPLEW